MVGVLDHSAANDKLKAIAAAASGQDADAKVFAAATLPTLKTHLKTIQAIAAAAGVNQ
jgi:hypothetical protein